MRLRKGNPLLIATAAVGALVTAATVLSALLAYYRAEQAVLRQAYHDGAEIVGRMKMCALEDPKDTEEALRGPRTPLFFVKMHLEELTEHKAGYAYVVDRKGNLLADSRSFNSPGKGDYARRLIHLQGKPRAYSESELLRRKQSGSGLYRPSTGTWEITTFSYVPQLDWLIVYHRPYRDVQLAARTVGSPILAVAGFVAFTIPLITVAIIKKVIHPYIELRAQERYKDVIDAVGDGIVVIGRDYSVVHSNRIVREMYGDTAGQKCYHAHFGRDTPCPDCPVQQIFASGESAWETREITDGSRRRWVESHATPLRNERGEVIAAVEVLRDITQRRQLEMELMLSARLRALGELAAGIAHEISTPMLGILTFSDMVRKETAHLPLSPETRRDLDLIRENAQRVVKVTDRIRAFSRREPPTLARVDVSQSVHKVLEMLHYQLLERDVTLALDPALPRILANEDALIEVVINLLVNAMDAMPEGGAIAIRSGVDGGDNGGLGEDALTPASLHCTAHVVLEVADTGCGIAPENLERIFEPGFSTKAVDGTSKGLGLGLFLSRGRIESFGGMLTVRSVVGQGATFTVRLPIV
ncbi:MAG: PAS domain-containing protein [Armatimonadetes bacterium]|nr:PAS domain-containing protein [Armatimonadota bacterium]